MKHEAGLASAATAGGGAAGATAAAGDGAGNNLAVAGVETADEEDLVMAVKDALGRAKQEVEAGGESRAELKKELFRYL